MSVQRTQEKHIRMRDTEEKEDNNT